MKVSKQSEMAALKVSYGDIGDINEADVLVDVVLDLLLVGDPGAGVGLGRLDQAERRVNRDLVGGRGSQREPRRGRENGEGGVQMHCPGVEGRVRGVMADAGRGDDSESNSSKPTRKAGRQRPFKNTKCPHETAARPGVIVFGMWRIVLQGGWTRYPKQASQPAAVPSAIALYIGPDEQRGSSFILPSEQWLACGRRFKLIMIAKPD